MHRREWLEDGAVNWQESNASGMSGQMNLSSKRACSVVQSCTKVTRDAGGAHARSLEEAAFAKFWKKSFLCARVVSRCVPLTRGTHISFWKLFGVRPFYCSPQNRYELELYTKKGSTTACCLRGLRVRRIFGHQRLSR
jgi:hypothetical protein